MAEKKKQNVAEDAVYIVLAAIAVMLAAALVPIALFVVVPVGILVVAYRVGIAFSNTDAARERKARANAERAYRAVVEGRPTFPTDIEFGRELYRKAPSLPDDLEDELLAAAITLYEAEGFAEPVAEPPPLCDSLEGWRYLDYLSVQGAKVRDPTAVATMHKVLLGAFRVVKAHMPEMPKAEGAGLTTRLSDTTDCRQMIEDLAIQFYAEEAKQKGLFADLRRQLDQNLHEASGIPIEQGHEDRLVWPSAYKGENPAYAYLKDTPLLSIFNARIPFVIPAQARFEHHQIVAGSGHGKSQTLQYLIAADLDAVAAGRASVVVIDSQGELIRRVSRLKRFAPGGDLHGRLVVIDPGDIEFPITLGLFSVGKERMGRYLALDRERLQNSLVELLSFTLGSLMSAEMTSKQGTLFSFLVRAMLVIPDATIHTFRELLEPGGELRSKPHLDALAGAARLFFETEYADQKQYGDTRRQVLRRLWSILENSAFERMMSSATSKFDLFTAMQEGKVICINTDKSLLQQSGTEIFGRFFIAMIAQAAQERSEHALPCFVYVDEFGDYAQNADLFITNLFQQARKRRISMTVAHQMLTDLSGKTADSIAANTSIKFVGGASHADASRLAKEMRTTPDFIHAQQKGSFAAYVRNVTPAAVSLSIPFGHMEAMERMTEEEWRIVRDDMRARYAQPVSSVPQMPSAPIDIDEADISPS